ncbi:GAF domain-containing protein [bacterium]|nr:GAF domain-containing protein [bacterium]
MGELRFLVIGSDSAFNGTIKNHIESLGHSVQVSDIDAMNSDTLQAFNSDSLIVDITDSDKRWLEILKTIAESGIHARIVVYGDDKNEKKVFSEIGGDVCAYLKKPFNGDELTVLINNIYEVCTLRREVTEKEKRVSYLEIINEITRQTLLTEQSDELLWVIARKIQEKLTIFNVNIFIVDDVTNTIVLKAFAGGFGEDLVVGYTLKMGEGITGWVAQNRQSLNSGNVKNEPRRKQGFSFEDTIQSELAVPIIFENKVFGVLHVEDKRKDAFTRYDVMVLETLADQISLTFKKMKLSRDLMDAYDLRAAVNDSLPVSILILNNDLLIEYVNQTFCEIGGRNQDEFLNQHIEHVFSWDLSQAINLTGDLKRTLEEGITITHTNIRHTSPSHGDKVLNFTFVRVRTDQSPKVTIIIQDVTENTKKAYQLSLLREISIAMQGVLDRDKLLHLILTCVTAGFAMGFNRAFIFLTDEKHEEIRGYMGVGPTSHEEAYRIWAELSSKQFTLEEYLLNIHKGHIVRSGLQNLVESIVFNLAQTKNILTETVTTGSYFHVVNAWQNPLIDEGMKRLIISNEFMTVPLIAKNQVIGVLLADNAYSGRPILPEAIEVLTMFASHAGVAIENARILRDLEAKVKELREAYIELEKTHDMLVRNEKLAAIGEVSARLAHEIRNPLATIGGFANSIPKKYEDRDRTIRNAQIIVDEVKRLESILTNVLNFSKPSIPKKTSNDLNTLVKEALGVMEGDLVTNNIVVTLVLAEMNLETELDASQIKQVFINVMQNAINAMSGGGAIEIITEASGNEVILEIRDTGKGIPEQYLNDIFEPFFTTRGNGTGLGLAISNRIIQNHQGRLEIRSKEGKGTTVRIVLPLKS